MSKYTAGARVVNAIYDADRGRNPYADAMPELLSQREFSRRVSGKPSIPSGLDGMSSERRMEALMGLSSFFYPLDYMYQVYLQLYRSIVGTYNAMGTANEAGRFNAVFLEEPLAPVIAQVESSAILGVAGVGKTSAIRRCLATMPQVISHVEYRDRPILCKQILYLHVECPSDCSIKTLIFSFAHALDIALGVDSYSSQLMKSRSQSVSALAIRVKALCMAHHVGLLVVDEIQNAVQTARRSKQVRPLIKFLVELTNDACTGVCFVGTPMAEELFSSEEHIKRRTRGLRLTPFKPDGVYLSFLRELWEFQYTGRHTPLTRNMANRMYDYTGGLPAYIVKVFQGAQVQAILRREPSITEKSISTAVKTLNIEVPATFAKGMSISDTIGENMPEPPALGEEEPRRYAKKRGRKPAKRDEDDLVAAFNRGEDIRRFLESTGSLEVVVC